MTGRVFLCCHHIAKIWALSLQKLLLPVWPVITTTDTPSRELDEVGCGWCLELSYENLSRTLSQAIALLAEEREAMGDHGRDHMKQDFSWDAIASGQVADYRQALGGKLAPRIFFGRDWHRYPNQGAPAEEGERLGNQLQLIGGG